MNDQKPAYQADNTFKDGDPRFIDMSNPAELAFWLKVFDTSEHELLNAVDAVGTSAQRVKDFLQRRS